MAAGPRTGDVSLGGANGREPPAHMNSMLHRSFRPGCVLGLRPDGSQPVHNGLHDNLISLVEDRRSGADEAEIRPAGQAPGFKNFGQRTKSVVRSHRMCPAHFLDACSDHSSAYIDRFDPKPHHDGGCQPSRSGKAAEKGVPARRLIYMEGLWVISFAEGHDLFGGDAVAS